AVLVTQAEHGLGAVIADMNTLTGRSTDQDGNSPFDGWHRLDAVFQVDGPEPRTVFTSGRQMVILTWSSQSWEMGTLGELPAGAAGLSAAFTGRDGTLYYFSADRYAEVDPAQLEAPQSFLPVDTRWGRPSLFSWLLSSVDGALVAADGKVH